MEGNRDDPLFQSRLGGELYLLLDHPLYLLVEGLDPVVRVDERAQFPRELIEREHVLGLLRLQLKLGVFPPSVWRRNPPMPSSPIRRLLAWLCP